jgi:hypothetical protein
VSIESRIDEDVFTRRDRLRRAVGGRHFLAEKRKSLREDKRGQRLANKGSKNAFSHEDDFTARRSLPDRAKTTLRKIFLPPA